MSASPKGEVVRGLLTIALTAAFFTLVVVPTIQRVAHNREVEARVYRQLPEGKANLITRNIIGSRNAQLMIIEFRDYLCTFCALAQPLIDSIVDESRGRIAVAVRHLPIRSREESISAAIAAECAAEQSRFEEYASQLWENQANLRSLDWQQIAATSGVADDAQFAECLRAGSSAWLRLAEDSTDAERLNVQGTPTYIIGRTLVSGLPRDRSRFRREVARALSAEGR